MLRCCCKTIAPPPSSETFVVVFELLSSLLIKPTGRMARALFHRIFGRYDTLVLTARGPFTGSKVGQVHRPVTWERATTRSPALSASGQAGVSAHVQPKAGALCAMRPHSFSCRRLLEARIDVTLCSSRCKQGQLVSA